MPLRGLFGSRGLTILAGKILNEPETISSSPTWQDFCLLLLLGLQIAFLFRPMLDAARSPYRIADDMAQQVAPFERYVDPGAVPPSGDLLGDFALAYIPAGYRAIFTSWSRFADPIRGAKLLTFLLHAISIGLLVALGRQVTGRLGGGALLACWLLNLGFPIASGTGGLPRSFALPLALLWLVGATSGRQGVRLTALAGAAIFFTPAVLPLGIAESFVQAVRILRNRSIAWRSLVAPAATFAVAGAIVLLQARNLAPYGPMLDIAEVRSLPELQPGGRFPIYPLPHAFPELRAHLVANGHGVIAAGGWSRRWCPDWEPMTMAGLLLVPLALRRRSGKIVPLFGFLAATLLAYALAREFAYRLYVPNRTLVGLPVVGASLALAGFLSASGMAGRRFRRDFLLVTAGALIAALLAGGGIVGALRRSGGYTKDVTPDAAFLEGVKQLPPGALLAGPIPDMDDVPLFGRRAVLVSNEMVFPLHRRYYETIRRRLVDLTTAYFARDRATIRDFAGRYGVSHFVVVPEHYTAEGRRAFPVFRPYDRLLRLVDDRKHPWAGSPLLAAPERESVVFHDGRRWIVDLERFLAGPETPLAVSPERPWRRFLPMSPAESPMTCLLSLRIRSRGSGASKATVLLRDQVLEDLAFSDDAWREREYEIRVEPVPLSSPPIPTWIEVRASNGEDTAPTEVLGGTAHCSDAPPMPIR